MEPINNMRDLDAESKGTLARAEAIVQRTKTSVLAQYGNLLRDDQRDTIEKRFSAGRCVVHSSEYHLREPLEGKTLQQRRVILNYHNIDGMDVYINESESMDTFEFRTVAETLRALSFQRPMYSPDLHQVYLRSGLHMMTLERRGDPTDFVECDWVNDDGFGISKGITDLYALRETRGQGNGADLMPILPYFRWAFLLESVVGGRALAQAYYGGDRGAISSCVFRLCGDSRAWTELIKTIDRYREVPSYLQQRRDEIEKYASDTLYSLYREHARVQGAQSPRDGVTDATKLFLKYAEQFADGADYDAVETGIRYYLQKLSSAVGANLIPELELGVFQELSPNAFVAFFSGYIDREIVRRMLQTMRECAIKRALTGEEVPAFRYDSLVQQFYYATIPLSQDEINKRWLDENAPQDLLNFRYAAKLSDKLSENVVRHLCM